VLAIWNECLASYGGPYLFGKQPTMADAMYAPVVTRFLTYDVPLDKDLRRLLQAHHGVARHEEWVAAAKAEPDEIDELDAEF
jgi:glutathione S-transferase